MISETRKKINKEKRNNSKKYIIVKTINCNRLEKNIIETTSNYILKMQNENVTINKSEIFKL